MQSTKLIERIKSICYWVFYEYTKIEEDGTLKGVELATFKSQTDLDEFIAVKLSDESEGFTNRIISSSDNYGTMSLRRE